MSNNRYTTPEFIQLASQSGLTPAVTPTAAAQTVQFLLTGLLTGQQGRLWNRCKAIWLEANFTLTQAGGTGVAMNSDQLWKFLQSAQVYTPVLGTLFDHKNTTGAVLGNLIQYIANGYNTVAPARTQIAAA